MNVTLEIGDSAETVSVVSTYEQLQVSNAAIGNVVERKAIQELPERQRMVLSLYYYEELNLKEIGEVLDVTESRVSQLHTQAVLRLRSKLGDLMGHDDTDGE